MGEIGLSDQLSYSLRRQYVDGYLERYFARRYQAGLMLDLGGVKDQQRGRFRLPYDSNRVITLNLVNAKGLDVRGDAARLPLAYRCFDLVLCSEVLEHVSDPLAVAREVFRTLRAGGRAVFTVPFLFRLHADPSDYGRYTEWYWRTHLNAIGFVDIEIQKQGLFWSVAVDMLRDWLRDRALTNRLRPWQASVAQRMMRIFRKGAISFDERQNEHPFWGQYPGGYGITAMRPE